MKWSNPLSTFGSADFRLKMTPFSKIKNRKDPNIRKKKKKKVLSVEILLEIHPQKNIKGDQLHQSSQHPLMPFRLVCFKEEKTRICRLALNTQPHPTSQLKSQPSLYSRSRHTLKSSILSTKTHSISTKCLLCHG